MEGFGAYLPSFFNPLLRRGLLWEGFIFGGFDIMILTYVAMGVIMFIVMLLCTCAERYHPDFYKRHFKNKRF